MDKNELRMKNAAKLELQETRLAKIKTKIGTIRVNRNWDFAFGTGAVALAGINFISGPTLMTPWVLAVGFLNLGLGIGLKSYMDDLKEEQQDIEEAINSYKEDVSIHSVSSDNSKVKSFTNRTNH